jgi:hypothetical protein
MEASRVYAYQVSVGGEMRDYVSILPPELAQRVGLPAESIVGGFAERTAEGGFVRESFTGNPAFLDLLNRVVARHGPDEPQLVDEARRVGSGYVYLIDGRTPDPSAPMLADDVIGAFQVRDGQIVREPYLPNPKHTVFDPAKGFFRLSDTLHRRLVDEVANRAAE